MAGARPSRKAENRRQRKAVSPAVLSLKPAKVFADLVGRNDRQIEYIATLKTSDQVFVKGPAGTGKTYIPARLAMQGLKRGTYDKIIIGRATVAKRKHALGSRPGKDDEKLECWMVPFLDGFRDEATEAEINRFRMTGALEFMAFETLRGRTFKRAAIILTEAASCDFSDLHLFLTRTGEGSHVVVEGDLDQPDIPDSGYARVLKMIETYRLSANIITFDESHVVRDPRVKEWVRAFRLETMTPVSGPTDDIPATTQGVMPFTPSKRKRVSAADKQRILTAADVVARAGELETLLQTEGVSVSSFYRWRRHRLNGHGLTCGSALSAETN